MRVLPDLRFSLSTRSAWHRTRDYVLSIMITADGNQMKNQVVSIIKKRAIRHSGPPHGLDDDDDGGGDDNDDAA